MLIKKTKEMTDSERIAVENSNNQYLRTLTYAPVGMIIPFGGGTLPNAFLLCDGSALDTTEYADLFNAIGYTYGGSDDKFNIPNLSGATVSGVSVKYIIKTANGITEEERLKILANVDQTYNAESENAQSGKAVAEAIGNISMPSVDQTYNAESENAQSGKAVAEAVGDRIPKIITEGHTVGFKRAIALTEGIAGELLGTDDADYVTVAIAPYDTSELYYLDGEIATYGKGGKLMVTTPTKDFDCANKAYVDEAVDEKVNEAVNDRIPKPTYASAPFLSVVTVNRGYYDGNDVLNDTAFSAKYIDDPSVEGKSGAIWHGGFLVQRDSVGNLWTGEPVDDQDCVPYSMYKALLERVEALEAKT